MDSPDDRLWDLRNGDADDNRASPYGRGWRGVLVSTALEFNFLTATLAFFTLVIVPVLLVGLAPPLILIYGRHKFDAATTISSHPLAAIFWIALLLGAGLWLGKRLLLTALDNFWHLHYTLVFPLFVGLRETISALTERLASETRASDDLDRRRRLGSLIAAMLLAGAGVLIAFLVGLPERPDLQDVVRQPWAVARAGVRNAIILLSLSTVAASLFWLWRESTSRRPLRDWKPGPPIRHAPTVRVAHLSDLHLVGERYGYRMECGTDGPAGNTCIRQALDQLSAIHASTPLDRVLVTGDVTDAGTRSEWLELIDLLRARPDILARVLFVPGNHDVNIIDRANTGRFDLPWSASRALRRLRFVVALDDIQGERVHLVDGASGTTGPSLRTYLRQGDRPASLRGLAERGSRRGRSAIDRVWDEIFPLIAPATEPNGCGVILLDSNARSHFSATNAIGVISRPQLRKLRRVLNASRDCAWLILLHHHVVEYPVDSVKLSARIALALMNATDLLTALAPHASRVVIFHGHRHHDWIGTKGDVVLCSAPSVALGSAGPNRYQGSFHINELALIGGGAVRLMSSEGVMVS